MSDVRWLRASYWAGAIADALAALAMLIPPLGNAIYGAEDFAPGPEYRYAMGLAASLMIGWTMLLLWADRKPVERRGVLPITVLVIVGLAAAGAFAVRTGLIAIGEMIPTWILQTALAVLFLYSYARSAPEA